MSTKSYKRELAFGMWLHIVYLSSFVENKAVLDILVWPYMAFILAAYGLQTVVTQTDLFNKRGSKTDV